MRKAEMRKHINVCASSVRKNFRDTMPKGEKLLDINWGLPYIGIKLPDGEEYFFQESAADEILTEAKNTAEKFGVSVENSLIWMAQSW